MAVRHDRMEIVKYLIEKGKVDPDCKELNWFSSHLLRGLGQSQQPD
jgi:hypothetical protein